MRNPQEILDNVTRLQGQIDGQSEPVDPPTQPMPNARRFIEAEYVHADHALLVHQGGQFYGWDGTCWPALEDSELRSLLYRHFETANYIHETKEGPEVRPYAPTRYKVADLLDALRAVTHIPLTVTSPSWLDFSHVKNVLPADELVACTNGLVHWPTRELIEHTPRYFNHHAVQFGFDPDAPRPETWLAFLGSLWGDDVEAIETLQEIMGYAISGDTRLQKMILMVGPKRSGKGTIGRTLTAMMGQHHVANPTLASLGTNFGLQPLIGKPLAIISDARLGGKSDGSVVTERMLSISGEDSLTIDRKNITHWTGRLPTRIIVLTNELPRLNDSSGALASRFIVLRMTESFIGKENPNLEKELMAELPAIFNWSLDGLERLRNRGRFIQPESSMEHIREMEDIGSPIGAFIRDECHVDPGVEVQRDRLYDHYKNWCENHGRRAVSLEVFGRDLRSVLPGVKGAQRRSDGLRYRVYEGIGLAQGGTCADPLQAENSGNGQTVNRNARTHVPPCATDGTCPRCRGEGCRHCGDTGRDPARL